jgi:Tfp pilus assembly protein PilP
VTASTKKKGTKGPVATKKTRTAQPKLAEVPPPEKGEKKKPAPRLLGAAGRRDPFVSPIRTAVGAQGPGSGCSAGKRCLAIPELVLRGTVRDISGKMLAVVSNSAQKTYTLRENDQVFNGSVEKITSDSIIFREFVKDALGRETAREVVKKLGPAS